MPKKFLRLPVCNYAFYCNFMLGDSNFKPSKSFSDYWIYPTISIFLFTWVNTWFVTTRPRKPLLCISSNILCVKLFYLQCYVKNMQKYYKLNSSLSNRLRWCSPANHSGLSSRRPGFKSRPEHKLTTLKSLIQCQKLI